MIVMWYDRNIQSAEEGRERQLKYTQNKGEIVWLLFSIAQSAVDS